ncbi:type IV secretion protein Rhs [Streptomyces sp. Tu 2975]|uniref:putative T7SS-secreted protein n=1 Tax=Streptomyces sp. Tu 2975 TaxID=2676871 RepID=UPI00135C2D7B|nr:polymorphic toxin type 28 domain-containing protein [Streptomyces sp. Tu 2975]QIP85513.1 type IV secretion protein Rhs [Streptomyces sp. Tu 2975]
MGIGDFVSDITPDVVEDAVEDGTEWLGDRVEDAGDWTADRLEDVGWESGADWVREQSRSLANRMGAEVDEMDLGQTEDKTKLIYGSPDKLRTTASHLRDLQTSFDLVGEGLKGLDSSAIKGEAADAFRETVSIEPPKWFKGADAFGKAADALASFALTVEWAQRQAQTAIDKWKAGTKASSDALDAHNKKVDDYNSAADRYNARPEDQRDPSTLPPKPGAFSDPGKAQMEEAQEILAEARKQRNAAADTARTAVQAARDAAPPKPSYAEQAMDGLEELQVMQTHFGAGIVKGTAGLVTFVRGINPTDPYNLTHPAEYLTNLNNLASGLVLVANDPWGAGKQMLDNFMKDPAEGFGRLVPDLLLTAATGGAGAGVKGVRVAAEAADLAGDANRARKLIDDVPNGTHDRPDGQRLIDETDPVDLASGRMFLPQTDAVLPGTLPLAFTRRVESGYTVGRFFGPSWSSTVDERLEIDAKGVVHVTDDGLLLTYPHPVPGVPTLPESGTGRRLLTREESGDYTVTDPESGLTRHFTAPSGAEPGDDGDAWLERISDRNGHSVTLDRDELGTPLALVHSAGSRLAVGTAEGRVTALSLVLPDGTEQPVAAYGYTDGNLTTVTRPSGATLTFEYDERRRVIAWIDSNGSRYDYAYDDQDRVIGEGGQAGHVQLTLSYGLPDPATGHRVTELTTADGRTTRHLIDSACRVVATTDPLGHTTRYTHDARGNRLTRTDALGRTTSYTYDEAGRLLAVVRPDGTTISTVRDERGLPVEYTEADGTCWRQEFDDRGNRVLVTDPSGRTTRYAYDSRGHLLSSTDALGAVTTFRCDAAGMPLEVTDPLGGTTRCERDAFGRLVRITDPLGAVTTLEWTADGELARRTRPDGSSESWTYDGEGNCTGHTDATGRTTRFEYTHFDLPAARTGPDGVRHEFEHDASLRLAKVTDPQGLTWSYSYDAAGRMVSETDFDGRTVRYAIDAVGQVAARTNPLGQTVSYERDQLDRVVRKDAAGAVTTYAYDRAGRMIRATGPDSELIQQYDRRGDLKAEMVDGRPLTYTYDFVGRRVRRITPTGRVTTYGYDAAGRPTHLTSGTHRVSFTHDAAGRELRRVFGDSLALASTWDETGRLAGQHLTTGARTINRRAYTYRADGHLTALDDTLRGSFRFDLDPAGRVTAVTAAGWSETYAYDGAGNQTSASWPAGHPGHEATGSRDYTGTTITRAGAVRYEHDAAGRITLRRKTRLSRKADTWHYSWDAEDRLTAVTTPDGTRWRYRYDPLGRRTAKQRLADDGESVVEEVLFTWDGATLCEQTTTAPELPRPVVLTWDHHGAQPLAQTERMLGADASQQDVDERFFAIVTDIVGTPTELVDESGDVAWHTRATLWGTTTWTRSATAYTPLRFPGQYYDPETGLHQNYFRQYDPETARYLTPDPLGLSPAPNPAAYVHNPFTWSDPLGLSPYRGLGLSDEAMNAINKLENIKADPIGRINSEPNHNHYSAARREAAGEVVARKPDGTPFDHVKDLTQAQQGLENVRRILWKEMERLPDGMTERGLEVLLKKHDETVYHLDRVKGFLHQIQR